MKKKTTTEIDLIRVYSFSTTADLLSPWAAFATVWSLGATCGYDGRYIFSTWLRDVQNNFQHKLPFPEDGLVYDYRFCEYWYLVKM